MGEENPNRVQAAVRNGAWSARAWSAIMSTMVLWLAAATPLPADTFDYDIVVYGGTPGGVTAAVQAARMGNTVALIEPTSRIGGMSTNGLGYTDVGETDAIQGLAREFYARATDFSGDPANHSDSFSIIPWKALLVFETMAAEAGVDIYHNERLDRSGTGIAMQNHRIQSIRTEFGNRFRAPVFIDAGYEGDLMAAAGVTYGVGRESNATYGERYNGVQMGGPRWENHNFNHDGFGAHISPYVVEGDPTSGLLPGIDATGPGVTGEGDHRLQSYNYRLPVVPWRDRLPWIAPDGYDASQYELLRRTISQNKIRVLNQILNVKSVGRGHFDINNQGPVSTDYIGQNYDYPEADYATRDQIMAEHRAWQQGLMYFLATDPSVPETIRTEMNLYGLKPNEFVENGGWPLQIYVREARRMEGQYVMTDRNVRGLETVEDSIGLASYTMDSHHTQRFVVDAGQPDAYVLNEGNIQFKPEQPYAISYQAITPRASEVTNLLVTSALSASHIAYGSIRMEPVFMTVGQAAGAAAALSIDLGTSVQDVGYDILREQLITAGGALLDWPVNTEALGDVNNDGIVDFLDIAPFINAQSAEDDEDAFLLLSPDGCFPCADIDLGGTINFLDITPFVNLLNEVAAAVPEPASGMLLVLGLVSMHRRRHARYPVCRVISI